MVTLGACAWRGSAGGAPPAGGSCPAAAGKRAPPPGWPAAMPFLLGAASAPAGRGTPCGARPSKGLSSSWDNVTVPCATSAQPAQHQGAPVQD